MLKSIVRRLLPSSIIKKIPRKYSFRSYSQEGEDLILRRVFEGKEKGFYVDVGAHHPKRFSNTFIFYNQGWRGINIDAMPGSMKLFDKYRPRDINIELPISNKEQTLTYYAFNDPALNGFSRELSEERNREENYFIKFTKNIITSTLEDVLDKKLPKQQQIDFISIDVEGLDYEVLISNDFKKYEPKVILIEMVGSLLKDVECNEITVYLKKYNYSIYAKTVNTVFFINDKFLTEITR